MSILSGLGGSGGAGGLASLLGKIPVVGGPLAAAAPLIQGATSLLPGGMAANMALDVAGGITDSAINAKKKDSTTETQSSGILF